MESASPAGMHQNGSTKPATGVASRHDVAQPRAVPGWNLNLGARTATSPASRPVSPGARTATSAVIGHGGARLRRAIVPTPRTWPSAPRRSHRLPWSLWACLALLLPASALTQQTLLPFGAAWRYRKGTNEVSSPTSAWRSRGFDAATWPLGPAPFSYGDGLTTGTTLGDMRGGYTCVSPSDACPRVSGWISRP